METAQQSKYILGFYDLNGYSGALVRLVLNYLKLDYEEYNPDMKEWFSKEREEFRKKGLLFPNIPFLIDGDFQLTESMGIPRYLCAKHGHAEMYGNGIKDIARHDEIIGIMIDLKELLVHGGVIQQDYKEKLTGVFKEGDRTMRKLEYLSQFLGEKEFLLGYLTFADIVVAFYIFYSSIVFECAEIESPMEKFNNLFELQKRVWNLPGIKEYVEGDLWKGRRIFPKSMVPWMK